MESIVSKHEFARSRAQVEGFKNNLDPDGLVDHYKSTVESGLYDRETIFGKNGVLSNDLAEMAEAQQKLAIENAVGTAFDAWQATVTEADPDGDLNVAFDVIEADPNVPAGDKQEVESEVKTRVENRRAETKLATEQDDTASVEIINGWINNNELNGITDRIKGLPLTETRKAEEVKKAKDYIRTVNNYRDDVFTSSEARVKVLSVISDVKNGILTRDQGIQTYNEIANVKVFDVTTKEGKTLFPINTTEGKTFMNQIFAAGEDAKDVVKQRQASTFKRREKQLRDAIEKQPNIFEPELATEILKDFANIAVIELNNKFDEGEFTDEEVKQEVDTLMRKYTLSEFQQGLAVTARELRLSERLEEQQQAITKTVESLRREGRNEEAKLIMDEAIKFGIFESDGDKIKKTKGKAKRGLGRRLLDRFLNR